MWRIIFCWCIVTAGLAESNGSLPPGSWLCHLAGWIESLETANSSGPLRSLIRVWNLTLPSVTEQTKAKLVNYCTTAWHFSLHFWAAVLSTVASTIFGGQAKWNIIIIVYTFRGKSTTNIFLNTLWNGTVIESVKIRGTFDVFRANLLQPPVRRMPLRKAVIFCACFSSFFY